MKRSVMKVITDAEINAGLNPHETIVYCHHCDSELIKIIAKKIIEGRVISTETIPVYPNTKILDLNKDFMCPICNHVMARARRKGKSAEWEVVFDTSSGEICIPKGKHII